MWGKGYHLQGYSGDDIHHVIGSIYFFFSRAKHTLSLFVEQGSGKR